MAQAFLGVPLKFYILICRQGAFKPTKNPGSLHGCGSRKLWRRGKGSYNDLGMSNYISDDSLGLRADKGSREPQLKHLQVRGDNYT